MLLHHVRASIAQMFSSPFRNVLWKSLGYTILLLIGAWFLLELVVSSLLLPILGPWPWVTTALVWITGAGMMIGAGFLIAPVSAVFAGIFLDDVAQIVEATHYRDDPPGREMPLGQSAWITAKFTSLVIFANLAALLLVLLPGINFIIFFFLNGFLLGREYFQFAALRFADETEVSRLRRANEGTIFIAGMVIAGLMAVPIINLATPIFAATLMTHIHKHCRSKQQQVNSRPLAG